MNLIELGANLPTPLVNWRGFGNPTMIDLNALTGDEVTPESSVFEPVVKLVDAVFQLQQEKNAERIAEDKEPIEFIDRTLETEGGKLHYVYTIKVEINAQTALNSIVNPIEN